MADNLGYTPGSGATVATDDISGVHFQKIKQADGADDSSVMQRVLTTTPGSADGGAVVRQAPCVSWSVGFASVGSALLAPELTQRCAGSGVSVSQSGSNLVVAAGTTANAEFLARSTRSFKGSLITRHKTILSARIANNNFAVMLADMIGEGLSCTINSATSISVTKTAHGFTADNIGQSMMVGAISGANGVPGRYAIASIPDANTINFTVSGWPASGSCTVDLFGWNYFWTHYTGTLSIGANIDAQRRGWNSGSTAAQVNTTAAPGHVMQMTTDGRNVAWSDTVVASSTAPTVTTRGSRIENVPDDDVALYVYLWSFNGTTSPGSSTNWTVGFVSVEEIPNVAGFLAAVRPQGSAAALPVALSGTQSVAISGGVVLAASTSNIGGVALQPSTVQGPSTTLSRILTGDTNLASVRSTATFLGAFVAHNDSATKFYVKIYNKSSAPVPGTDVPVLRVPVPPNSAVELPLGAAGLRLTSGFALAVTRGLADADTTAVAANDGVLNAVYV